MSKRNKNRGKTVTLSAPTLKRLLEGTMVELGGVSIKLQSYEHMNADEMQDVVEAAEALVLRLEDEEEEEIGDDFDDDEVEEDDLDDFDDDDEEEG